MTAPHLRKLPDGSYVHVAGSPRSGPQRMRPQHAPAYVWCDYHGEIHGSQIDFYEEHTIECSPLNWRKVYINGTKGEFLL